MDSAAKASYCHNIKIPVDILEVYLKLIFKLILNEFWILFQLRGPTQERMGKGKHNYYLNKSDKWKILLAAFFKLWVGDLVRILTDMATLHQFLTENIKKPTVLWQMSESILMKKLQVYNSTSEGRRIAFKIQILNWQAQSWTICVYRRAQSHSFISKGEGEEEKKEY